jgi:hypothetical protein
MTMPSDEQQQRARWDLLLLDIEHRSEQIRQMKTFEGRRLAIQAVTAAAAVFAAGGVVGGLLVNLLRCFVLIAVLAASANAATDQPPYSCRLYYDEQKKCAFGSCDRRALDRLKNECLRDGGRP